MKNNIPVTKNFLLTRQLFVWLIFYFVLVGGVFAYAKEWYSQHDENQLPSGHIELMMSKSAYQLGETVEFTVVNRFPTTVYVTNHCPNEPLNVYRWEGEQWVVLHDTVLGGKSVCASEERNVAIPTEGSRTYNFSDWPNLFKEPGVYRIALVVDHYIDIPFEDFVILQPAEVVEIMEEPVYKTSPTPVVPAATTIIEEVPVVEESEIVVVEKVEEEEERENEDEREEENDD
ncbi:MAG: hypothetical protein UU89_C0018G0001 [Parcubacteria group bacterium GW2011_GWC2_42_11]|nr:MAG: hypothetical protein UU89_C0018G0001 [Parcubacteria group bacterium GW2011_GWC2_42_11]